MNGVRISNRRICFSRNLPRLRRMMYNKREREKERENKSRKNERLGVIEDEKKEKKRIEERSHGFYYNEINPSSFGRIERTVAINHDRLKRM